ncbi:MAG TPA: tetratricopeptide repeat protein [Pseudomonadales bacterium]|nr:tetratricopeptide repeat protein [Pseudomonadales bacterium]
MRILLPAMILFLASAAATAQEQYRSRMYIDLDQAATENVSLSVGELEKQMHTFQDDATRASAEKFLAQHYAGQKDFGKAAQYIEESLKNPATPADSKHELYGELARIALLQKNYEKAADAMQHYLAAKPSDNPDMYLLLAQIQYKRQQYVESAAALDKALALQKNPGKELLQSALAVYYSIGSFDRAAQVIQQLVSQDFNNAELWQQWVSLYLKAGKNAQALDVMALAWEKGIPFRDQDIVLLTDLYAINKIPGRGARVLEEAIASGRIKADAKIHDRLFRLYMQAGERDKAQAALEKAASTSHDTELQLHLAQLLMEKEQWQPMQAMVLKACDGALPERLVARANLLLGVSQLKLGDRELARRSFINATVVGGATEQAAQWLAFMKAEPATKSETAGIAGPCYSDDTHSVFTASMPSANRNTTTLTDQTATPDAASDNNSAEEKSSAATTSAPVSSGKFDAAAFAAIKGDPHATLDIKTTESQKLYVGDYALTPEEMSSEIIPLATKLGIAIVKNGGKITGPMHIIFPEPPATDGGKMKVRFAFPITGNPPPAGRFQLVRDNGFKCVSRHYEGTPEGVPLAIAQFYADAIAKGLKLSGESRQIASTENVIGGKTVKLELQIGVLQEFR